MEWSNTEQCGLVPWGFQDAAFAFGCQMSCADSTPIPYTSWLALVTPYLCGYTARGQGYYYPCLCCWITQWAQIIFIGVIITVCAPVCKGVERLMVSEGDRNIGSEKR